MELAPVVAEEQKPSPIQVSPYTLELTEAIQSSGVPEERRFVIVEMLKEAFNTAAEYGEQADKLVVKDHLDKPSMAIAKQYRLALKNTRLAATKAIDAKREEVQARMADDKLEDQLLLRTGQIVKSIFSRLEDKLEEKEKFAERYAEQLREQKRLQRELTLHPYGSYITPGSDFMSMDDNTFNVFVSGLQAQKAAKEAADAKAEEERLAAEKARNEEIANLRLHNDRLMILGPYIQYVDPAIPGVKELHTLTQEEFDALLTSCKQIKDYQDNLAEQAQAEANRRHAVMMNAGFEYDPATLSYRSEYILDIIEYNVVVRMHEEAFDAMVTTFIANRQAVIDQRNAEIAEALRTASSLDEIEIPEVQNQTFPLTITQEQAGHIETKYEVGGDVINPSDFFTDGEQLKAFADGLMAQIKFPEVKGGNSNEILTGVKTLIGKIQRYIHEQVELRGIQ